MSDIFYEGQQVGCLMFGEGVIELLDNSFINVQVDQHIRIFCINGAYYKYARPTLYPIEQYREIIANLPAPQPEKWQPKPGEWCWFWDGDMKERAFIARFKGMYDGCFMFGNYQAPRFQHCAPFTGELPEHLKEVQP
jgi:hypothetical protein